MNREQLLEFAQHIEAGEEDDQWQVVQEMIHCASGDGADGVLTESDAAILQSALDEARRSGLSTVPLAIALEFGRRIVPNLMRYGMTITGPSDQLPSDFARLWSIKFDGVRLGLARTLTLAVAAAICRIIATQRDRAMAATFLRERRQVSAEVAALQARLGRSERE